MRKIEALDSLLKKPLFTSTEAKKLGIHPAVLAYYVKIGKLKRINRGIYQSVNKELENFRFRDLIEATYSIHGGIICLLSALAIYDLTEEIPRQHWIGIRQNTSAKKVPQIKTVRLRNMELGKTSIELEGVVVPIFDRERTIIDAFRLLSREIAIKALKIALTQSGTKKIDLLKLQEYAKKLRVNIDPYLITATT